MDSSQKCAPSFIVENNHHTGCRKVIWIHLCFTPENKANTFLKLLRQQNQVTQTRRCDRGIKAVGSSGATLSNFSFIQVLVNVAFNKTVTKVIYAQTETILKMSVIFLKSGTSPDMSSVDSFQWRMYQGHITNPKVSRSQESHQTKNQNHYSLTVE